MSTVYSLYDFTLNSELELPAASLAQEARAGGVSVRFGTVPAREGQQLWYEAENSALIFEVEGVGRFRVSGGTQIVIDPADVASDRNLRTYLLGSAMGALLQQRGLLSLHANAVEIEGRAFAFLGKSGAGKSTLAAWFADRGHRILCDDVCAIRFTADEQAFLLPGVPRLRLWRDALVESGRRVDEYEQSFDDVDKYDVPTADAAAGGELPLAGCYVLGLADEGSPGEIVRLAGISAVDAIVANTYRGKLVRLMGLTAPHLRQCLAVVRFVPVHLAARRWGRIDYESEAKRLRDHAFSIGAL